jgi:hypothetical protein
MEELPVVSKPKNQRVHITGVNIPFWDLVILITKVAIASIPAAILIVAVVATAVSFLAALSAVLASHFG